MDGDQGTSTKMGVVSGGSRLDGTTSGGCARVSIQPQNKWHFTAIENDRVGICRAVGESGECSSCFRRYLRLKLSLIWPATPVGE